MQAPDAPHLPTHPSWPQRLAAHHQHSCREYKDALTTSLSVCCCCCCSGLVCSSLWLVLTAWPYTRTRSCRGDYAPCVSFTCDFASDNVWAVLWGLIFVLSVVSLSARVTAAAQFVGLVLSMVMLVTFLSTAVLSGLARAGLSAQDIEAGDTWVTLQVTPVMSKQAGPACGVHTVRKQQCEGLHTVKGTQGVQKPTPSTDPHTHHKHTSHTHHTHHTRHSYHSHKTQHTPYASNNSSSSTNSTAVLISAALSAPASTPRASFTSAAAWPAHSLQQQQQQPIQHPHPSSSSSQQV